MRKTIRICDKCEKPIQDSNEREASEFVLFSTRKMNGAGDCDDWHWSADLCNSCLKVALKLALSKLEKLMSENDRRNFAQVFNAKEV